MNKLLILLLTLVTSTATFAFSYKVALVELIAPEAGETEYSAFASDGQVYSIDGTNSELVELAEMATRSGSEVKLKLSEHLDTEDLLGFRNEIQGIKILSENNKSLHFEKFKSANDVDPNILMSSYVTNLEDENKVNDYFSSMRRKFRRKSECFNRAYVWSWEASFNKVNGQRVHFGKTWLFFSKKYIRAYKYKWWFHIAPYINLNGEARMLDRSFLKVPSTVQEWTDEFIYSKEKCKVVNKYSDYRNNQEERDCFLMQTSVHYWQPKDIENAELNGTAQKDWKTGRLKGAYKNAVGIFAKPPERD